jgi:hypothetical protein
LGATAGSRTVAATTPIGKASFGQEESATKKPERQKQAHNSDSGIRSEGVRRSNEKEKSEEPGENAQDQKQEGKNTFGQCKRYEAGTTHRNKSLPIHLNRNPDW